MVSKGFPNVTTSGRQYNIGEKPSVILYCTLTLISMQEHQNQNPFNLRVLDYRTVVVVVVFTLKAVPVSTQYFLASVLVQLTRTPSVVTG